MSVDPDKVSQLTDMVVIQYGSHVLKGYARRASWVEGEETLSPLVRLVGSDSAQEVPLDGVKAVFFVHGFEGKSHEDLRFHDHLAQLERLWVRIVFDDGETIEGTISNSLLFVTGAGFFMSPVDPEGNNWLIYVRKQKLKEFNILGLRSA